MADPLTSEYKSSLQQRRAKLLAEVTEIDRALKHLDGWLSTNEEVLAMKTMSFRALVRKLLPKEDSWSVAEMFERVKQYKPDAVEATIASELSTYKSESLADLVNGRYVYRAPPESGAPAEGHVITVAAFPLPNQTPARDANPQAQPEKPVENPPKPTANAGGGGGLTTLGVG